MKATLVVLLVTVCANTDSGKSEKADGAESPTSAIKQNVNIKSCNLKDRIQEVSMSNIVESAKFLEMLSKFSQTIRDKLTLNSQQQKELNDSLEMFKRKDVDDVEPKVFSVDEINTELNLADILFEADIILSKEQRDQIVGVSGLRSKRQAYSNKTHPGKWPNRVPYMFDTGLNRRARKAFKKAARLWQINTCINFTEIENDSEEEEDGVAEGSGNEDYYYYEGGEYDDEDDVDGSEEREEAEAKEGEGHSGNKMEGEYENDVIFVHNRSGCSSSVGRQPRGMQLISLGHRCETIGTAAHEIAHALGFWHAHARHDRDQYITVVEENINGSYASEFLKQTNESNNNYGLPYDYGSVMHYRSTAASINKKPTMVPKDGRYTETLGSLIIGFLDLFMMNIHYNCTALCENNSQCKNNGFPRPRNCSECICPSGYGGQYCDQRPPGCGKELDATKEWTILTDDPHAMNVGSQDGYKWCNYWIKVRDYHGKAPKDKKGKLEVTITKLPEKVGVDGCIYSGVEIKAHHDQRLTGYRFCSKDDINTTLTTNSSTLPVVTYMRRRRNDTVTELKYRFVEEK